MTLQGLKEERGGNCDPRGLVQPRRHRDTAGPYGIMETFVTLCGLMEPRGHCVIVDSHGIKEVILTLQGLMEARDHCDTVEPHGNKRPV